MKLSSNFDLAEFVVSQQATRQGIDNTPSDDVIVALMALCEHILEPLRQALGPVRISSGYRNPALNRAIGGAAHSQHCLGEAADLSVIGRELTEVFNWIYSNAPFDQVIREFPPGGWVHVSYSRTENKRIGLLAKTVNGRTVYQSQGLIA